MVQILLSRLGYGTTTSLKCRTYTDEEGRFSIVGGVGSHLSIKVLKKGYSTYGRSGSLKGNVEWELLQVKPDAHETLTMWENTGFDKKKLIINEPSAEYLRFDFKVPIPPKVRLDLVRGVIAKENEDWGIQVENTVNGKGVIENPDSYYTESRYLNFCHITINHGKMSYFDDPLPELARPKDGFSY